jgi:hypothetical protein
MIEERPRIPVRLKERGLCEEEGEEEELELGLDREEEDFKRNS